MRFVILLGALVACAIAYDNEEKVISIGADREIEVPQEITEALRSQIMNVDFQRSKDMKAIINNYTDEILEHIDYMMIHYGFDPIELPDTNSRISHRFFLITYWGELNLTKGWLQDASSIHRSGDAILTYSPDTEIFSIEIPLAFNDLQLYYDYHIRIMGLGPSGGVTGKIKDFKMRIVIEFDTNNLKFILKRYDILHTAYINVKFNGHMLIDWLINLSTNTTVALLKPIIQAVLGHMVKANLTAIFEEINKILESLLISTTSSPVTEALQGLIFT